MGEGWIIEGNIYIMWSAGPLSNVSSARLKFSKYNWVESIVIEHM